MYDEFREAIKKAYEKDNQPSNRQDWMYAFVRAYEYPWRGRSASSDRAVCFALANRARYDVRDGLFRATTRELAELAGITNKTALASLRRLQAAGIIEWRGAGSHAGHLYCFTKVFLRQDEPLRNYTTILHTFGNGVTIGHDAAHFLALGKHAMLLWQLMTEIGRPVTRRELEAETNMTRSQVSRALNKLQEFQIAQRDGWRWSVKPCTPERMDGVAWLADTLGTAQKRKETNKLERAERAAKGIVKARGLSWPTSSKDRRPAGVRTLEHQLQLRQSKDSS